MSHMSKDEFNNAPVTTISPQTLPHHLLEFWIQRMVRVSSETLSLKPIEQELAKYPTPMVELLLKNEVVAVKSSDMFQRGTDAILFYVIYVANGQSLRDYLSVEKDLVPDRGELQGFNTDQGTHRYVDGTNVFIDADHKLTRPLLTYTGTEFELTGVQNRDIWKSWIKTINNYHNNIEPLNVEWMTSVPEYVLENTLYFIVEIIVEYGV